MDKGPKRKHVYGRQSVPSEELEHSTVVSYVVGADHVDLDSPWLKCGCAPCLEEQGLQCVTLKSPRVFWDRGRKLVGSFQIVRKEIAKVLIASEIAEPS